jgi:hypothetical protein
VTTYKAVKVGNVRPGDLVAVSGVGGLGHLAVQYAKIFGGTVAGVDITDEKLKLARELGADIVIDAGDEDRLRCCASIAEPTPRSAWPSTSARSPRPTPGFAVAGDGCRHSSSPLIKSGDQCFLAHRPVRGNVIGRR